LVRSPKPAGAHGPNSNGWAFLMEKLSGRLLSWASILEPKTLEQAKTASTMPFIYPHLALMPDAHLGKGATVGSVIPTLGAIMPAAVGVDIGCGMAAVRTQYTVADLLASLVELREAIESAIPLSAGNYNDGWFAGYTEARIARLEIKAEHAQFNPENYAGNWRNQLGSLGSGNHFIEVTVDESERV
jgi:tRNA-splicing ligase RtcB (3'-phosphate/5'-hydroxy nucleic acid ligase)